MNTELSVELLKEAAQCFHDARRNVYDGARLLYRIYEEKLWEGQYSSFSEYTETECQLSKGYASKLLQSWQYFVVDGGFSAKQLHNIDAEKLYMALKLPDGTPEQRLVKAREWSRDDFRAELSSKEGVDCPCDVTIRICTKCGKRVYESV
jgi:hypothetical protein